MAAEVTVQADAPVREVLANLITNALRHTPAGGAVAVSALVADPWLEIRIVDTGPGIDPAVLLHVFERFVKSPGSGGSGLGLAMRGR